MNCVISYRLFRRSTGSFLHVDFISDDLERTEEDLVTQFAEWEVVGTSIMTQTCCPNHCGE
jgi:hypothetical protein